MLSVLGGNVKRFTRIKGTRIDGTLPIHTMYNTSSEAVAHACVNYRNAICRSFDLHRNNAGINEGYLYEEQAVGYIGNATISTDVPGYWHYDRIMGKSFLSLIVLV